MKWITFQITEEQHNALREVKKTTGAAISYSVREAIRTYCENLLKAPNFSQDKNGVET